MLREKDYRPELDGLRGISVLCILLYHTEFQIFKKVLSGAFVTLDIFFVISGYLITKGIIKKGDSFSYKEFYIRRVKRLFPALFLTVFSTLSLGFFIFTPGKVVNLAKTAFYSILPLSNIYFSSNTDYFAYDTRMEPFVHTWSLALEEQFYLIYPVLLIWYLSKKRSFFTSITVFLIVSALSILTAEYFLKDQATFVYYLLPFRVYELLAGALICFLPNEIKINKYIREFLISLGILLIGFSVAKLNFLDPFPGVNSIFPTVGTFIIILLGRDSYLCNKLFAIEPFKIMGASSYAIYLYHWPVLVFAKYLLLRKMTLLEVSTICITVIFLGILSWKFFEQPFLRIEKKSQEEKRFLKKTMYSLLSLIFLTGLIYFNNAFPERYPSTIQNSKQKTILKRDIYWEKKKDLMDKNPDVLFIGNSHAVDLIYMFLETGINYRVDQVETSHRCNNFVYAIRKWDIPFCNNVKKQIFHYKNLKQLKRIYLHDYWAFFNTRVLKKFLIKLRKNTNAEIVLFGPKMAYLNSVLDIVQVASLRGKEVNQMAKESEMKQRIKINKRIYDFMKDREINDLEIKFIDLLALQCGKSYSTCLIGNLEENILYYFDDSHFNLNGARFLGKRLKESSKELFEL